MEDIGSIDFTSTLDIESLHSNVPHKGALEDIKWYLDQRELDPIPKTS